MRAYYSESISLRRKLILFVRLGRIYDLKSDHPLSLTDRIISQARAEVNESGKKHVTVDRRLVWE